MARPHPSRSRAGRQMALALLGVGLTLLPARAQTADELQGYRQGLLQLFQRLDRNGDRRLQRREVEGHPYLERHFERLDRQQRGYLRAEDLLPRPGDGGERAGHFFSRADSNGDGRLDRQETEAYPWLQRRFGAIDRDGDGTLQREELRQRRGSARRDTP